MQTDRQTDRQTILVYFAWPTKRPGGHQSQLTTEKVLKVDKTTEQKSCLAGYVRNKERILDKKLLNC